MIYILISYNSQKALSSIWTSGRDGLGQEFLIVGLGFPLNWLILFNFENWLLSVLISWSFSFVNCWARVLISISLSLSSDSSVNVCWRVLIFFIVNFESLFSNSSIRSLFPKLKFPSIWCGTKLILEEMLGFSSVLELSFL